MSKVNCKDCSQEDCAYYGMNNKTNCKDFVLKAQPAKQWVGLTDEQKLSLEIQGGKSDVMLAELVEGWLKEKNCD